MEELVLTILSQNTNDVNRDRAFSAMRRRYPSWEDLAEASVDELIEVIRPGGLGNTKGPRLLAVLREIREREGSFDLSWMRDASDEAVAEYLTSLPGVGPKTAACVLAFSLGRPALPVDTHVHRVAVRLGLIPDRTPAGPAHRLLAEVVEPDLRVPLHVGLIRHGRTVCRSGHPLCESCVLQDLCPSAAFFLKVRQNRPNRLKKVPRTGRKTGITNVTAGRHAPAGEEDI
jgi:endonuclease-3